MEPGEAFEGLEPGVILRAPPTLYASGDIYLLRAPRRISIIGSRDASELGVRRASPHSLHLVA